VIADKAGMAGTEAAGMPEAAGMSEVVGTPEVVGKLEVVGKADRKAAVGIAVDIHLQGTWAACTDFHLGLVRTGCNPGMGMEQPETCCLHLRSSSLAGSILLPEVVSGLVFVGARPME